MPEKAIFINLTCLGFEMGISLLIRLKLSSVSSLFIAACVRYLMAVDLLSSSEMMTPRIDISSNGLPFGPIQVVTSWP